MDNENKPEENSTPGKKEMKKQLAEKIAAAIPELKLTLGEKKFEHRVKKAVKLITEGLHKKDALATVSKIKAATKKASPKKRVSKTAKTAKKTTS